ncbi:hypothetical protein B0H63DRAFT_64418 [Podospora didyma]|uniref:NTF2-like domain-containing protein n=1 Tax=Podospora didyma TaxID=330526 RepID=A0AAE0P895_9PEZI|nr:hypothetical protein B0H63DRAFT_64418 [Podospora didyma]
MRFIILAILSLAAIISAAALAPAAHEPGEPHFYASAEPRGQQLEERSCLCTSDVDSLLGAYVRILSKWNATADAKYIASNFKDTSDSINILAGIPLGTVTFPSRDAFLYHENTAPDNLPIKIVSKGPFNCDTISFIWSATFGAANLAVRGITILGATRQAGFWQIKTIDVEFNSLAFWLDIGGTIRYPGQPPCTN